MNKEELRNDPFFNLIEIIRMRKKIIIICALCIFVITIIGAIFLIPPVYEASTKVYINTPAVPKGDIPYLDDLRDVRSFVSNQPAIASSRFIYEKVVKELRLDNIEEPSILGRFKNIFSKEDKKKFNSVEDAIGDLYRNTDVSLLRGTNILQITALSGSSKGAADIANTLAKTYTDYVNSSMLNKAQTAYEVVSGQFKNASNALSRSQSALSGLQESGHFIEERIAIQTRLAEYKTQYEQIQEQIQKAENTPTQKSGVIIYEIQPLDSPRVKELKSRLLNLKKELDSALSTYTENYPKVINLRGQIKVLEDEIASAETGSSDKAELDALKSKRDSLSRQIQPLEAKLMKIAIAEGQSAKLGRDITNQETAYLAANEKFETASVLKEQLKSGTITIIDIASPPSYPSNKKRMMLMAIGFIASIVFGLGAGFIAEYLDNTLRSPEDVEKNLNLPVLTAIPHMDKKIRKEKSRKKGSFATVTQDKNSENN